MTKNYIFHGQPLFVSFLFGCLSIRGGCLFIIGVSLSSSVAMIILNETAKYPYPKSNIWKAHETQHNAEIVVNCITILLSLNFTFAYFFLRPKLALLTLVWFLTKATFYFLWALSGDTGAESLSMSLTHFGFTLLFLYQAGGVLTFMQHCSVREKLIRIEDDVMEEWDERELEDFAMEIEEEEEEEDVVE